MNHHITSSQTPSNGNPMSARLFNIAMAALSLILIGGITTARAERTKPCVAQHCDGGLTGKEATVYDGGWTSNSLPVGANTEQSQKRKRNGKDPYRWGFGISIDGERLVGDETVEDQQRSTDIGLNEIDIQVKFDGLGVKPILNVTTENLRHSYRAGDRISFVSTTNYPGWIKHSEVRIYDAEYGLDRNPLAVIKTKKHNGQVGWRMPAEGPKKYVYILRVYDNEGRFDETIPLTLRRTSQLFNTHRISPTEEVVSPGEGEDRTAIRNIPVYGGAVTVFGRDVPEGYRVRALSEKVSVDLDGSFVVQRILPPGNHKVKVLVSSKKHKDGDIKFDRNIHIPESEWFYVGLADYTVNRRLGRSELVAAGPDEFKSAYANGRFAFYLKGKIKGRYILTAAADTGEENVQNIFKNIDGKSPKDILRRIDPEKYYPVYGDDSVAIEDAPTDGKFFVKLEHGNSHIMWGRFKTTIKDTELVRNERKLYGARALYKSETITSHGSPKIEAEAYASRPGTLPQRDTLRGTGGSVYFLTRQDINHQSETITVEIRDEASQLVLRRVVLQHGEDYDINYVQGIIILKKPLASSVGSSTIVGSTAIGGDEQYLVAQYEYTPGLESVDGFSSGGRAQAWVTNNVRVGVSGINEKTGGADQRVVGGDVHVRLGNNSYAEIEVSRSSGPGFGGSTSINGGLTINNFNSSGQSTRLAFAHRAKVHLDLMEFNLGIKGHAGAYYEWRGQGYSSIGYDTPVRQRTIGAFAKVDIRDNVHLLLKYRDFRDAEGRSKQVGDAEFEYGINDIWSIGTGIKHTDIRSTSLSTTDGGRTDVGVRLTKKEDEDRSYYVFGQLTVANTGNLGRNDRGGIGGEIRITEKIGLQAEASYGTLGWGGLAAVAYDQTADDRSYFGYKLDPERALNSRNILSGRDLGGVVIGTKHRHSEQLSSFAENNYDIFGDRRSLTSTYGVVYSPTAQWVINGGIEYGDIKDTTVEDLERIAFSASALYKDPEKTSWRLKGEARFENSPDRTKDRDTYLLTAGVSIKQNDNWRFLAEFDTAISKSNQAAILDGDYVKGSIGYAYRPVANDKINSLVKYTFLYDLPGPDQVSSFGNVLAPAQRSHIFSADINIDVSQHLTIGGKYGARIGSVSLTRSSNDFVRSSAHLGILRADIHFVKNWDALFEARVFHTPEIDTTKFGYVAAIYRHFGNETKFGIGYNFGSFSDNVADLTFDEQGIFANLISKF